MIMNKPRSIELSVEHHITDLVDDMYNTNDELLLSTVLDCYNVEEVLEQLSIDDIVKYVEERVGEI